VKTVFSPPIKSIKSIPIQYSPRKKKAQWYKC
jgi:hypothetical protein